MKYLFISFLILGAGLAQASEKQRHQSLAEVKLQQVGIEFDRLVLEKDFKSRIRDLADNNGKYFSLDFESHYTTYGLKAFHQGLLTECTLIAKDNADETKISIANCSLKNPKIKHLTTDYLIKD